MMTDFLKEVGTTEVARDSLNMKSSFLKRDKRQI